ncbi:hypothetical protein GCM10008909_25630 [Hathewaya limosa]|uniref:immunoglobulin-like domain-containing protein n=1 Tax=Hathewaya limosa TaxID=1536 RepID=UPI0031DBE038
MKKNFLTSVIAMALTVNICASTIFATEISMWKNVKSGIDEVGQNIAIKVSNEPVNLKNLNEKDISLDKKIQVVKENTTDNKNKKDNNVKKEDVVDLSKKSIEELYKDAYYATTKCLNLRTQESIKEARDMIARIPSNLQWAIGEFSKQVDSIQQPIFEKIIETLEKAKELKSQLSINESRKLIKDVIEDQYKATWSAELDKVQQEKISNLVKSIQRASIKNDSESWKIANEEMKDIDTVEYNDGVKQWIYTYRKQIDVEIVGVKELTNKYSEVICNELTKEEIKDILKCSNKDELIKYLKDINADKNKAFNAGRYWASKRVDTGSWEIQTKLNIEDKQKSDEIKQNKLEKEKAELEKKKQEAKEKQAIKEKAEKEAKEKEEAKIEAEKQEKKLKEQIELAKDTEKLKLEKELKEAQEKAKIAAKEAKEKEEARIKADQEAKEKQLVKEKAEKEAKEKEKAKIETEKEAKKLEEQLKLAKDAEKLKLEKELKEAQEKAKIAAKEAKEKEEARIKADQEAKEKQLAKEKAEKEAKEKQVEQEKMEKEAKEKEEARIKKEKEEQQAAKEKAELERQRQEEKVKIQLENQNKLNEAKQALELKNIDEIESNLNLPITGENEVQIKWESSRKDIIDNTGRVVRPKANQGNMVVTLNAILSLNGIVENKQFMVTVKAEDFTNEEYVEKSFNNLDIKGNLQGVVDNIKLCNEDDENKVSIIWNSSNESIISNDGIVTRSDKDENVILTATLSKGEVSKVKTFNIVVKAKEENIEKELQLANNALEISNVDNIEKDINLKTFLNDINITWTSSDEGIISSNGKVIRPQFGEKDRLVTLTATLSKKDKSITKEFNLTVKAEKQLVANSGEEFNNIIKEAVRSLKQSISIKVPKYDKNIYNFDHWNDAMVELGGEDYGKPTASASIRGYQGQAEQEITIKFTYMRDITTVRKQKEAVEEEVKRIVKEVIKDGMTDFQKELALHDYIVKNADYNMAGLNKNPIDLEDHNAYGVLILHKGVCESYAKAMQLLLKEVGIECKYATGKSKHDGRPGGGHAWNMVKLDNEWYNLDATWDDPVSDRNGTNIVVEGSTITPVIHTYFNVTDNVLNQDHIRGDYEERNYPRCTSTKYAYDNMDIDEYTNDGKVIPKVTNKEELDKLILEALKTKKSSLYLRIKGLNMTQKQLSEEVKVVANGKFGLGWETLSSDKNHVLYKFNWV